MNVPVTFALDLPTHGTAVAQRKQLLLLSLSEENQPRVSSKSAVFLNAHLETQASRLNASICETYFVPGLYGEEDVREEGLRSDGAVESDDAGQERPEDHQDVDIPAEGSKR